MTHFRYRWRRWRLLPLLLLCPHFHIEAATLFQWNFDGPPGSILSSSTDSVAGVIATEFEDATLTAGATNRVQYGSPNPWYNPNGASAEYLNTAGVHDPGVGLFVNDSGVNSPLDLTSVTNLTVEAFVYPYDVRQAVIIRKYGSTGVYYLCIRGDGKFGLSLKSASQNLGDSLMCNDMPYTTNQWYHVAMVWDGSVVKFYVDGVQSHDLGTSHLTAIPFSGPIADSSHSLGIGAIVRDNANPPADSGQFFFGRIDEIRISDKALLPSQFLINQPVGAADHLVMGQQPGNTAAGQIISPAVTVRVVDQLGNPTIGTNEVALGIGNNPSDGTLTGTLIVAASHGVATFSDLSIDRIGSGYTLVATAQGLTGTNSSAFNIVEAGVADHLAIGQQPSNGVVDQAISPAVTVQVEDSLGNTIATNVDLTMSLEDNPGGATLSGTLTVAATNGVATFSDLSIDNTGSGYTLAASAPGLTGANSAAFDVTRTWQSGLALAYTQGTNVMPYRLYLPWHYNPAHNYPLVLFLHGSGEYGTDNIAQVANHIAGLIDRTYSDYPAILLAPQLNTSYWSVSNPDDLTLGILAQVRQYYAVDERRIYLTGLSAGGFGTTDYAENFPTLFAAIAPMSGAEIVTRGTELQVQLSQLPTWLFCGSADGYDASVRSYYMNVNDLTNIVFSQTNYGYPTAAFGPIRYTEFTGNGHDIWELIYGATNTDFYDWMFSQTRPPATFTFTSAAATNGSFVIGGSNSVPFAAGFLLTSTNLLAPPSRWQCIATNWCDANGHLMFTNNLNAAESQRFYLLKSQ